MFIVAGVFCIFLFYWGICYAISDDLWGSLKLALAGLAGVALLVAGVVLIAHG
jgi:hypothetical protein